VQLGFQRWSSEKNLLIGDNLRSSEMHINVAVGGVAFRVAEGKNMWGMYGKESSHSESFELLSTKALFTPPANPF